MKQKLYTLLREAYLMGKNDLDEQSFYSWAEKHTGVN